MTPEEQKTLDAWVKANTEIFNTAFESSQRYSNLFILAGYGTFFGLWNITRDRLYGRHVALWAALSMVVSVTIFAVYQVVSVYRTSSALIQFQEALLDPAPNTLTELIQRYEDYGFRSKQRAPKQLRFWRPIFFLTVLFGFLGIGILGLALVQALWSCPVPYSCL